MLQARPTRGVRGGDRERIQRIRDGLQVPLREMEVQHGVPHVCMPQQQLNRPQIRATLKQVRGIGMPTISLAT